MAAVATAVCSSAAHTISVATSNGVPVCRRQMLSCGCRFDEDPPYLWDDEEEDEDVDAF
jgi:hypothetical protein